jgi:hypothetical protein
MSQVLLAEVNASNEFLFNAPPRATCTQYSTAVFEVLTAERMKITVFRDVTPSVLVNSYWHYGGTSFLYYTLKTLISSNQLICQAGEQFCWESVY